MSSESLSRAILPEGWPLPRGYANGMVADGRVLVTGGLVGWDENGVFAKGFLPQLERTFLNIKAVVEAGGGRIEDIVRMTWYVTEPERARAGLSRRAGPAFPGDGGRSGRFAGRAGGAGRDRGDGRHRLRETGFVFRPVAERLSRNTGLPIALRSAPAP